MRQIKRVMTVLCPTLSSTSREENRKIAVMTRRVRHIGIKFFFLFIIIRHHSGRRYALHRIRIYKYILSCLSEIHTYKKHCNTIKNVLILYTIIYVFVNRIMIFLFKFTIFSVFPTFYTSGYEKSSRNIPAAFGFFRTKATDRYPLIPFPRTPPLSPGSPHSVSCRTIYHWWGEV